jgi:hypothetical protein
VRVLDDGALVRDERRDAIGVSALEVVQGRPGHVVRAVRDEPVQRALGLLEVLLGGLPHVEVGLDRMEDVELETAEGDLGLLVAIEDRRVRLAERRGDEGALRVEEADAHRLEQGREAVLDPERRIATHDETRVRALEAEAALAARVLHDERDAPRALGRGVHRCERIVHRAHACIDLRWQERHEGVDRRALARGHEDRQLDRRRRWLARPAARDHEGAERQGGEREREAHTHVADPTNAQPRSCAMPRSCSPRPLRRKGRSSAGRSTTW